MKKIESSFLRGLLYSAIGGISYCTADGLLVLPPYTSARVMIAVKSISLPVILIMVLYALVRGRGMGRGGVFPASMLMVLGIWVFSPVFMFVMSMFSEQGTIGLTSMWWLSVAFPLTSITVSTFSGGLAGLFLSSLGLPVAAMVFSRVRKE